MAGFRWSDVGSGAGGLRRPPAPLWPFRRGSGQPERRGVMLKLRIITALVLLPIVLGALFLLERQGFALIAGVFFLAAGWEWSAMAGRPPLLVRVAWLLVLAALMVAAEYWRPLWLLTWLP